MALYRLHLLWQHLTPGVQEDFMSWSWGIDASGPPDLEAVHAAFIAARTIPSATTSWVNLVSNRLVTRAWELRPAAGGPTAAYYEGEPTAGNAAPGPPQVTIPCQAVVQQGLYKVRAGRFNFGPTSGATALGRPSTTTTDRTVGFFVTMHNQLLALGVTPVVLRAGGTIGDPILGYSIGNAYGTMRSRSSEVTERTTVML